MTDRKQFQGELKFIQELTDDQLAKVKSFLGEDCRDHPEWGTKDLYKVDFEFLDDFSGLQTENGQEKIYNPAGLINLIIDQMRIDMPEFGLTGEILVQSEYIDDRYFVAIRDGQAVEIDAETVQIGSKIKCPHCEQHFEFRG